MDIKSISTRGIVRMGNLFRTARVMKKAASKEEVVIGFIGGSITMGSLSSTPQRCYAYLVYEWWTKKFPDCNFKYINAGIGATTSQFGVARVDKDLLSYKPDFVTVEFSVNDRSTPLFKETYEGLIRKIINSKTEPAAMIINNLFYQDGTNTQDIHNEVGDYYGLPIVSIRDSLYPEVRTGNLNCNDITPDNLHPNDTGHKLVADIIINFLELAYNMVFSDKVTDKRYGIPKKPVTANRYQDSIRYQNKDIKPVMKGFVADETPQYGIVDVFKNGWHGKEVGESITFEVEGSMLSIQFKKTIKRIAPVAVAIVDGYEEGAVRLDANFKEDWGDFICLTDLLIAGEKGKHIIEIKIIENDKKSDLEFYLISVIAAGL